MTIEQTYKNESKGGTHNTFFLMKICIQNHKIKKSKRGKFIMEKSLFLEIEIDSDGIIAQMKAVESAQINLKKEMSKLRDMLWKFNAKEKEDSEESPNN